MKNFIVWFYNCPSIVEFNDKSEAIHYARLNAGIVKDMTTGETIASFEDEPVTHTSRYIDDQEVKNGH